MQRKIMLGTCYGLIGYLVAVALRGTLIGQPLDFAERVIFGINALLGTIIVYLAFFHEAH
jgi:hypothetical protein